MNTPTSSLTKVFASLSAAAAMGLAGCSSMPVTSGMNSPLGGDDQQNTQVCLNFEEAQAKAAAIPVGTPKMMVYEAFGLKGDTGLKRLNKEELNRTLYGQTTLSIPFEKRDDAQTFLNSLDGRSLTCQNVHSNRRFGITHTEVEKTGYQYTITFIFKDAALFDPVSVAGEPVHQKTNRGYLSDLSPVNLGLKAARGGL
jgi:hypothetical protein